MALSPAGANMKKTNGKTGWSRFRPVQLGAALLLSTGVLSAAVAVAAAREPDPMDAYGPSTAQTSVSIEDSATPTATSSTAESPELVASSWSMDPLPEGEDGAVASSTSIDPITPSSSMVASPQ